MNCILNSIYKTIINSIINNIITKQSQNVEVTLFLFYNEKNL